MSEKLTQIFLSEKANWALWIPVIFGFGVIFHFSFPSSSYLLPLALLILAIFTALKLRGEVKSVFAVSIVIFLSAVLWAKFFEAKFIAAPKIKGEVYANLIGKVEAVKEFEDGGKSVVLSDLKIYKAKFDKKAKKKKEKAVEKKSEKKKAKKKSKKSKSTKKKITEKSKKKAEEKAKKTLKKILKSHLNVTGYIDPDRELEKDSDTTRTCLQITQCKEQFFTSPRDSFDTSNFSKIFPNSKIFGQNFTSSSGQNSLRSEVKNLQTGSSHFQNNKYLNPPKKVSISLKNSEKQNIEIGDIIQVKAILQKIPKHGEFGNFNFERNYYFKQIGGTGFSISAPRILEKNLSNKYLDQINSWRYKAANKIMPAENSNPSSVHAARSPILPQGEDGISLLTKDEAAIFNALLLGIMDFISPSLMQNVRISGLAHLLSISGLHMSFAAGIFFVLFRFLLSRSEFLTLRFNIKKIAAFLAIISSLAYLIIAGSPIPAIRSFFMILIFFLAILFDQNSNPMRSLGFGALLILIINPTAIFSISFQLSFAAILALMSFSNFFENAPENRNVIAKFLRYFLGIVICSIIAQIALTPLIIYYFNNFAVFGILANLIAIPITTFIIMPLAFIYLFLLPFGLEKILLYPLHISLEKIVQTINFVATLPYSNLRISNISTNSLILMSLGFLWLSLWQKNWRYFGLVPIFIGAFLAFQTPLPSLVIDGERKFIAVFDEKKGLFFSKKVKPSFKIKSLMQKFAEGEFKTLDQFAGARVFNSSEYFQMRFKNKEILVLTGRAKIAEICAKKYDILVNLSKYQLPNCFDHSKPIINNQNLENSGSKYLYL